MENLSLALLNIGNDKRKIFCFCRNEQGKQVIVEDSEFYPFYFEKTSEPNSQYISYDGKPLRKVFVSHPSEVSKNRSSSSYSSDIKFTTNYLINKVDEIVKCPIKHMFLDIEVMSKEMSNPADAKYPISCITIFNSFSKEYKTWYLGEWKNETLMLDNFVSYIKEEAPDLILAWSSSYDYGYLYNRIEKFSERISPVGLSRYGENRDILYPCGISIIDYLRWFKKIHMREASYTLDYIGQKHLGKGKEFGKVDFSVLSDRLRQHNVEDVELLVGLENKYQIIPYFDEIRRLSKCQFEDCYHNSRIVESLIFQEAKKQNVVLPNKPQVDEDEEETTFEGATREAEQCGLFEGIGEFDLSAAYPSMIANFCLDPSNIICQAGDLTKNPYDGTFINGVWFKQNSEAMLPLVVKRMLVLKDRIKKEKDANQNDKYLSIKYDAIKGVVNSIFGVTGLKYFRLFSNQVASSITYLVRDLLMYVKEQVELKGNKVIYWDTDALFINTKKDITEVLNGYIKKWALEKYGKKDISLVFERKGWYTSLFILGSCLHPNTLIVKEDGGVEEIQNLSRGQLFCGNDIQAHYSLKTNKLLKIKTTDGLLVTDENHINLVYKKDRHYYKESSVENDISKNLKVGDYLLSPKYIPHKTLYNFSPEMLAFISMVICDGHLSEYSTECGWHKQKSFEKGKEIFLKAIPFFTTSPSSFLINENERRIRIYGKDFVNFLHFTFDIPIGYKREKTTINSYIFYSSLEAIKSFIDTTLFFEGSIRTTNTKTIQMLSYDFLSRFQLLIKKFGISSTLIENIQSNKRLSFRLKIKTIKRKIRKYDNIEIYLSKILKIEQINKELEVYDYKTQTNMFVANVFLTHNCHYHGYMMGKKDPVIKGIEGKRASSSKFEGGFQLQLLDLIHKKSTKTQIEHWITSEIERFKTLPLEEIAFPAKIGTKVYKNLPIFMRALTNTKRIKKSFNPLKGELFFYLFLNTGKNEVIAFTENDKDFIDKKSIDYDTILKRSILTKVEKIFSAMSWVFKNPLEQTLF
jgi:DNA polymerase elongation subunit (family B)